MKDYPSLPFPAYSHPALSHWSWRSRPASAPGSTPADRGEFGHVPAPERETTRWLVGQPRRKIGCKNAPVRH